MPPYQFSQLNALSTSTVFHGSPEPRMVAGKLDGVEGDVVLAHELDVADVVRALRRCATSARQSPPVASAHSSVAAMYSIGASNQT